MLKLRAGRLLARPLTGRVARAMQQVPGTLGATVVTDSLRGADTASPDPTHRQDPSPMQLEADDAGERRGTQPGGRLGVGGERDESCESEKDRMVNLLRIINSPAVTSVAVVGALIALVTYQSAQLRDALEGVHRAIDALERTTNTRFDRVEADIHELRSDTGDLRERVARIEGWLGIRPTPESSPVPPP